MSYNREDDNEEYFCPIGVKLDKERIKIYDPQLNSYNKGGSKINWYTSKTRYMNDDGKECVLCMGLPEQYSFGVNFVFPVGINKEDKILDNAVGLQVCYNTTHRDTINNPTPEEKIVQQNFELLELCAWEKLEKECKKPKKDRIIPAPSYNSYLGAKDGEDIDRSYAIKPICSHPLVPENERKSEKIEFDINKPKRSYHKLPCIGKGRNLKSLALVHGPGDQDVSAMKYIDVKGYILPVVKWEGIFWGSHGQSSTYGASVRLKMPEFNFTPIGARLPDHKRMLPQNNAPIQEIDVDEDEIDFQIKKEKLDSDDDDEDFLNPGEDNDPMDILSSSKNTDKEKDKNPEKKLVRKTIMKKKKPQSRNLNN